MTATMIQPLTHTCTEDDATNECLACEEEARAVFFAECDAMYVHRAWEEAHDALLDGDEQAGSEEPLF